jgi:hypothetical protein
MKFYEKIILDAIKEADEDGGSVTEKALRVLQDIVDWDRVEEHQDHVIFFTEDPSQAECKAFETCKMLEKHYGIKTKIRENEDSVMVQFILNYTDIDILKINGDQAMVVLIWWPSDEAGASGMEITGFLRDPQNIEFRGGSVMEDDFGTDYFNISTEEADALVSACKRFELINIMRLPNGRVDADDVATKIKGTFKTLDELKKEAL